MNPGQVWDGLANCAYWQHLRNGGPPGTCTMGSLCGLTPEPHCLTDEPATGWKLRSATTGRFVSRRRS